MESQSLLVEGKKALFIISMNLRKNIVKERLYEGKTVSCFAAWGYGDADHIERLAPLKPHGIFLEGEHGDVDYNNIPNLTRACDIIGATPIVRINQNDQGVIYRTLDLGALGIVVPHVNNKEEAENVVEGGKFYPLGKTPPPFGAFVPQKRTPPHDAPLPPPYSPSISPRNNYLASRQFYLV